MHNFPFELASRMDQQMPTKQTQNTMLKQDVLNQLSAKTSTALVSAYNFPYNNSKLLLGVLMREQGECPLRSKKAWNMVEIILVLHHQEKNILFPGSV